MSEGPMPEPEQQAQQLTEARSAFEKARPTGWRRYAWIMAREKGDCWLWFRAGFLAARVGCPDEGQRERAYHAGFEEFDRTDDLRAAFDAVLTCVAGHSDDPKSNGYDAGHERGRMIGREEGWREAMGPDRGDEYVLLRPDGNEERWTNLEAFLRGCIRIATASLAERRREHEVKRVALIRSELEHEGVLSSTAARLAMTINSALARLGTTDDEKEG